jgi:single-stranded DNA-binding protein
VVHHDAEGTAFTSLNVTATTLAVVGPNTKNFKDFDDITTCVLWGFMGRNAEVRYTPNARVLAESSIGVPRFAYEGEGEERTRYDITTWWRVTIWGDAAETAAKWWTKGKGMIFKGIPTVQRDTGAPRIWTDQSGEDRASYEFTVYSWTFAPGPRGNGGPSARDEDFAQPVENADEEIPF